MYHWTLGSRIIKEKKLFYGKINHHTVGSLDFFPRISAGNLTTAAALYGLEVDYAGHVYF